MEEITFEQAEAEAIDALRVTRKLASELAHARSGDTDSRRRMVRQRTEAKQRLTFALATYERLGGDPHRITYRREVAA